MDGQKIPADDIVDSFDAGLQVHPLFGVAVCTHGFYRLGGYDIGEWPSDLDSDNKWAALDAGSLLAGGKLLGCPFMDAADLVQRTDEDGVASLDDCDPTDSEVGAAVLFYFDADLDGFGDPNEAQARTFCTAPERFVANASDCDDSRADIHPSAGDVDADGRDDLVLGLARIPTDWERAVAVLLLSPLEGTLDIMEEGLPIRGTTSES